MSSLAGTLGFCPGTRGQFLGTQEPTLAVDLLLMAADAGQGDLIGGKLWEFGRKCVTLESAWPWGLPCCLAEGLGHLDKLNSLGNVLRTPGMLAGASMGLPLGSQRRDIWFLAPLQVKPTRY